MAETTTTKRTKRARIDSPDIAAAFHRLRVTRWLQAPYDKADSEQDIESAQFAGSPTAAAALRALNGRPFGWSAPESIEGSPADDYCQLVSELVGVIDDGRIARSVEHCLVHNGRLPSRRELADLANVSERQSGAAITLLREVMVKVFNAEYLANVVKLQLQ